MIQPLRDLAEVRAGHPFRGSVPVVNDGNAQVIQMRDIAHDGSVSWGALARTRIAPHNTFRGPDWLQDGDVLFAARGGRNYAVCLSRVPPATVCAQYFFVLRLCTRRLMPRFLAWYINRAPSQRYLTRLAEGSDQLSIRRGVLEDLPVAVPDMPRQRQLVDLADAAARERHTFDALARNRERELDALAHRLLQTAPRLT